MTHRFRNVIAVVAAAAWLSAPAGAQQPQQAQAHDHDAHHRDMLTRGAQAMGFDQERTVHHFLLYEDGGAIDVAVKEASDHANLHAVRQHLQQIAGLFKAGDFGKPALTHAQQVPGTVDMTRLKDRITYQYEETPAAAGGCGSSRAMRQRSPPSTHSCTSRSRITAPAIRVWCSDRRQGA